VGSAWRLDVLGPVVLLGVTYAVGGGRLWRRAPGVSRRATAARAALALGALASLALALASPLHELVHERFSAHMVQHVVLTMMAAPALLLADPWPAGLWALPAGARAALGRLLAPGAPLRRAGRAMTRMPVAWLAHAVVLWLWHIPPLYEAALAHEPLHDLEHLTLFGSALLFWWPIANPAPRLRGAHPGWQVVYLVLAAFQSGALGLLLAASPSVLYPAYATVASPAGLTPLEDQAWGGLIMWGVGGAIEMAAVLVLLGRFLSLEERKALRPFP
jgi:putative membrane protein